jgi:hypothetical protein
MKISFKIYNNSLKAWYKDVVLENDWNVISSKITWFLKAIKSSDVQEAYLTLRDENGVVLSKYSKSEGF